jgi:hypothetical protein
MRNVILVFNSILVFLSTTHAARVTVRPPSGNAVGVFDLPIEGNFYSALLEQINALPDTQWRMPEIGRVGDNITFLLDIEPLSEHFRIEDIADLDGKEITIIKNEQRLILPFMSNSNWTIVLYGDLSSIKIPAMHGKTHNLHEYLDDRMKGIGNRMKKPNTQDIPNFAKLFLNQSRTESNNETNYHGTGALNKYISYRLETIVLIHKRETDFVEYTLKHKKSLDGIIPIEEGIGIIDGDGEWTEVLEFQGSALQALQNIYDLVKESPHAQIDQEYLDTPNPQAWELLDPKRSADHALFHNKLRVSERTGHQLANG